MEHSTKTEPAASSGCAYDLLRDPYRTTHAVSIGGEMFAKKKSPADFEWLHSGSAGNGLGGADGGEGKGGKSSGLGEH